MKKKIGTRIIVMLAAMAVMYLVTSFASGYAQKLSDTMAQMAEGIDGINTAVDESAQGVTMAAQSTGELVEALVAIKGEADTNREISEDLQGEVMRFKHI